MDHLLSKEKKRGILFSFECLRGHSREVGTLKTE